MAVTKKVIKNEKDIDIAAILMQEMLDRDGPFEVIFGPEGKVEGELTLQQKQQQEVETFKSNMVNRIEAEKEFKAKRVKANEDGEPTNE